MAIITCHCGRNNLSGLSRDENEIVNFELCVNDFFGLVVRWIVWKCFLPKRHELRAVNLAVKANVHGGLQEAQRVLVDKLVDR